MTIQEFKQSVRGKQIAVVGAGVSNLPLIEMLAECGAETCVYDKRTAEKM